MVLLLPKAADADSSPGTSFALYHYDPTEAGAMIFILLFLATTTLHFWQLFRSRCLFAIPLAVGGIFEMIGYGGRFASSKQSPDWTLGPYMIQAILLLVAPALFAASIYMELGRIIILVDGESRVWIPTRWMTKIFVLADIFSFFLQGGGGGYQASGTISALKIGSDIIIAGLFVQLAFFGLFIITAVTFNITTNRRPTESSRSIPTWRKHMRALYGFHGYILRHEAYLYIFDAVLMLAVMGLFNFLHPGEITSLLGIRDGSIELKFGQRTSNTGDSYLRMISPRVGFEQAIQS